MSEELDMLMEMSEDSMKGALLRLEKELAKIRAGRATPSMLDSIFVDYYGSGTPLAQVSNINTMDARTLTVQPWEKAMIDPICKGIIDANIGLNPQSNGDMVILHIPVLTEERRRDLVKKAKAVGEDAKVKVRSARKEANDEVKKMKNDGLSEDQAKMGEETVQKLTNRYVARVDDLVASKEADIMTV